MSHADPSARQLGFLHGSSLEVGTSPNVLPPAEGALACQAPSGGRRGDATSRDAVSLPSANGHDGIGNPGTGESHSKGTNATDAVDGATSKTSEHDLANSRALAVERMMAEANVGYDSVQGLPCDDPVIASSHYRYQISVCRYPTAFIAPGERAVPPADLRAGAAGRGAQRQPRRARPRDRAPRGAP